MFKNFKKLAVIVSCMVFGLFLFCGFDVSAKEAILTNDNAIVLRDDLDRENTYYYVPDDANWSFKVEDGDPTLLRWRVVNPDGSASVWSDYIDYTKLSLKSKFTVNFDKMGDYSETVDVSSRESIAKANTWYVDIEYWDTNNLFGKCTNNWLSKCELKDSETIKIIKGKDVSVDLNVTFNKQTRKATIIAKMQNSKNQGVGIINKLGYFYTNEDLTGKADRVLEMFADTEANGVQTFPQYNSYFNVSVTDINVSTNKYMVVVAESVNGQYNYSIINLTSTADVQTPDTNEGKDDNETQTNINVNDDSAGLVSDFKMGELILIVLLIVLIVSCALIITQKIVDYKKRLY